MGKVTKRSNQEIERYYFEMLRRNYPLPEGKIAWERGRPARSVWRQRRMRTGRPRSQVLPIQRSSPYDKASVNLIYETHHLDPPPWIDCPEGLV